MIWWQAGKTHDGRGRCRKFGVPAARSAAPAAAQSQSRWARILHRLPRQAPPESPPSTASGMQGKCCADDSRQSMQRLRLHALEAAALPCQTSQLVAAVEAPVWHQQRQHVLTAPMLAAGNTKYRVPAYGLCRKPTSNPKGAAPGDCRAVSTSKPALLGSSACGSSASSRVAPLKPCSCLSRSASAPSCRASSSMSMGESLKLSPAVAAVICPRLCRQRCL